LLAKHWSRIAITLVPLVFALLHASRGLPIGVLQRLDDIIYDARLRATMPRTLDERIVIVDIDEKSLAEVGRWPWGRNRLAELVDELFDRQKVAIVGFDVVFAEPDDSSGLKRLRSWPQGELKDQPASPSARAAAGPLDYDAAVRQVAEEAAGRPGLLLHQRPRRPHVGQLPSPVMERRRCRAGRSASPAGTATAPTSSSWPRPRRWPASSTPSPTPTAWCARSRWWPNTRTSTTSRCRWPCSACWSASPAVEPGFPQEPLHLAAATRAWTSITLRWASALRGAGGRPRDHAGAVPRAGRRRPAARSVRLGLGPGRQALPPAA
jgi:hypothetical protein